MARLNIVLVDTSIILRLIGIDGDPQAKEIAKASVEVWTLDGELASHGKPTHQAHGVGA